MLCLPGVVCCSVFVTDATVARSRIVDLRVAGVMVSWSCVVCPAAVDLSWVVFCPSVVELVIVVEVAVDNSTFPPLEGAADSVGLWDTLWTDEKLTDAVEDLVENVLFVGTSFSVLLTPGVWYGTAGCGVVEIFDGNFCGEVLWDVWWMISEWLLQSQVG